MKQMERDGRIQDSGVGCIMPEDEIDIGTIGEKERRAWDDQTGEELEWDGVTQARGEEMREVHKHGIYTKVPTKECWDKTGKAPIKTRWLDINKGDKMHPEYRSRLVAKDFKRDKRLDLFAAMPPLEALKLLISLWMTEGVGWENKKGWKIKMDFIDIRRAYFHAEAQRDMYVELPNEDKEEGMCV